MGLCVCEKRYHRYHIHMWYLFFSGRFDFLMCVCEKRYHRYHIHKWYLFSLADLIFECVCVRKGITGITSTWYLCQSMSVLINLNLTILSIKGKLQIKKKYLIKGILEYEQWHSVFSSSTVETASNAFNLTFFKILQEQTLYSAF